MEGVVFWSLQWVGWKGEVVVNFNPVDPADVEDENAVCYLKSLGCDMQSCGSPV